MKQEHKEYIAIAVAVATAIGVAAIGPLGGSSDGPPAATVPIPTATAAGTMSSAAAATSAKAVSGLVTSAGGAVAPTAPPVPRAAADSPRRGPAAPKVTVIEAADFDCPSCSGVPALVRQIGDSWPSDVAVVFKHVKRAGGTDASAAALAAMAAHRQGKFWEYHDKLLSEQKLADADLIRVAGELGLDTARFDADRRDPDLLAQVQAEQRAMTALGYDRATAFLVNGRSLQGAQTFESMRNLIELELKVAGEVLAKGTPLEGIHEALARTNTGPQFATYWNDLVRGAVVQTPPVQSVSDLFRSRETGSRAVDPTVWKAEVFGHEPVKGKPDAIVTIVEFSDFQCAFCAKVGPVIERIMKSYPEDVRVVWKSVALSSHERAMPAAQAALVAHEHGKFWEMHDKLFAGLPALASSDFARYAVDLGIGAQKIDIAIKAGKYKDVVQKNMELAQRINARGAPIFFVNGRVLRGVKSFEEFIPLIEEELGRARVLLARGVARKDVYAALMADAKVFEPLDATVHTFDTAGRPFKGVTTGDLTVIAYIDYESMTCADTMKALNELLSDPAFKSRLRVVIKQAPHGLHRMAEDAALAALAAHAQGKFWEMSEKLFANQRYMMPFQLAKYAKEVGLDTAKYTAYLAAGEGKKMLQPDIAESRAAGLVGAPTLYINGRRMDPQAGYSAKSVGGILRKYFPRT